ncbi:9790_t:CDS:1, partial [Paraglomus occultum]
MDDYRRYRQKPQQDPNAARNELFGGPQRQPNYPPPGQYPPPSQYGGAPQNPYGQNPYGGYGQNPYGGGGYPPQGGYSPYGQQRTEEEEVDEIKTQIRQTKLDSLQSTHNSLAAIQRAEQSAQITLNKLGEQS